VTHLAGRFLELTVALRLLPRPVMPSRVPIALLMTSFEPGGTERQMTELIRRLDRSRFEVHVAALHRRGAWLERVEECAASIEEFPIRGFGRAGTLTQARRFAAWCRARGLALVHTADRYANIFGLPAAALAGVPVRIANRREINPANSPAHIALQRAAYACAHVVVANCRAAADRLVAERVPNSRVRVVPNGIDLAAYAARAHEAPIRRIVTVANLRREKAHEVLFEAVPMVLQRCPDAEFIIAGNGPRRHELEGLASARGIGSRVRFIGHTDDVASLLASSDMFVLPSRSEAFPNSLIEAMAAGLPIVATRVGGIVELVDNQRTGVLVPPDNPRALGHAILDLIQWRSHAARLGRAARADVESRYSWDRMISSFERLYLEQLGVHARVRLAAAELIAS
jgi:glycosyltransferase involved in cell wall biosynthesis